MEYSVFVDIIKTDKTEDEVEVYFELDDFYECVETDEKIDFIIEQTKKQYKGDDIKKVHFNKKSLKELERDLDDINDVSDMICNETFEEFMEHEDFD